MYISFARKFRPQDFDQLVGQEHIATTLKNAITLNKVSHAYLFTGPRGIGKTSTARILSKALNCVKGPTAKPCHKCDNCLEIAQWRSLDVIEIDGASNRGIDEIRTLRENVKFAPVSGKYKIYIIDEVHQITTDAFNALLKTLEEPPPYVKFIFATTSPHKVPPTIISRCQRFDFKRISSKDIVAKLKEISQEEKLEVNDEALFAIAKSAEGSLRDAEVLLDQLSSFSQKRINLDKLTQLLGLVEEDLLLKITEGILQKDSSGLIKIIAELEFQGKDLVQLVISLIEHFRNILVAKVGVNIENLIDLPKDSIATIADYSKKFTLEDILYIIQILLNCQEMIRRSNFIRLPIEVALIKLATKEPILPLPEVLEKLSQLEKKLGNSDISLKKNLINPPPKKPEVKPEVAAKRAENPPAEVNLEQILALWPQWVERAKQEKMSLGIFLSEAQPLKVEGIVLTIGFAPQFKFHKETLEDTPNRLFLEKMLKEVSNLDLRLNLMLLAEEKISPNNESVPGNTQSDNHLNNHKVFIKQLKPDPIIESALNIFDGYVVRNKYQKINPEDGL